MSDTLIKVVTESQGWLGCSAILKRKQAFPEI